MAHLHQVVRQEEIRHREALNQDAQGENRYTALLSISIQEENMVNEHVVCKVYH